MRSRNRHSASNYLFAALLELVIMGLFVIIAQPQLRQSLFDAIEPAAKRSPAASTFEQAPAAVELPFASGWNLSQSAGHNDAPFIPQSKQSAVAQPAAWSMRTAGYAPFEQMESFTVSSGNNPNSGNLNGNHQSGSNLAGTAHSGGYPHSQAPTHLSANDWSIGASIQSPRPMSGWTAARPAELDYRDTYPPPFGTQSQWK